MKDWKYILYVGSAIALFVIVKLLAPKQYDWVETYAYDDKNPYGAYAFNNLLPEVFKDNKIRHSYQTLYELKDTLQSRGNLLIIASRFNPEKEDVEVLLKHVSNGGSAFISAEYFSGILADTLRISARDFLFDFQEWEQKDTTYLKFSNTRLDTAKHYLYRRDNIHNYFHKLDTTGITVIARNDLDKPVTISMHIGNGNLILNSTPLAFTNIYILAGHNHEFVSTTLSNLPSGPVQWTEYYQMGRMETATPLRFILTNESLKWAYYLTIFSLLIFMIFEAKRKQRIIPIMKPLANTTMEFVTTIGNLYYQNGNHKDLAEKKILFLLDKIRTQYLMNTAHLDEHFIRTLTLKSGRPEGDVRSLFRTINYIQQSTIIAPEDLIDLNSKIENFNRRS
jgi:hypothetical protein